MELGYLLPEAPAARSRVRDLCARGLGFENHALAWYRRLLLPDLTRPALGAPRGGDLGAVGATSRGRGGGG